MKLDLKRFKKMSSEKDHTILQNPEGHQIRIAHGPLSPKMKSDLDAMPQHKESNAHKHSKETMMAEGGKVPSKGNPKLEESKKTPPEARYVDGGPISPGDPSRPENMMANGKEGRDPRQRDQSKAAATKSMVDASNENGVLDAWNKLKAHFESGGTVPQPSAKYADGTNDHPITKEDIQDSPEQIIADAQPQQQAAPATTEVDKSPAQITGQAIGSGIRTVGHGIGSAVDAYGHHVAGLLAPVVQGVKGVAQGISGTEDSPTSESSATTAPGSTPSDASQGTIAPPGQATPPVAADPFGTNVSMDNFRGGLNQQMQGIAGQAAATGAQAQATAKAEQQAINAQQQIATDYQTNAQKNLDKRAELEKAIADQKIDPDQYIKNMSTGESIGTVVGLLLGGLGSGGDPSKNVAMNFLNRQVDLDIDAQKAELGKKNNLLTALYHDFGNIRDASDMARIMTNDMLAHKIQMGAAQAGTQMANSIAEQSIGKLRSDNANNLGQMTARQTLLQNGAKGNIDPARVAQFTISDPKEREQAMKHIETITESEKLREDMQKSFDDLNHQFLHGKFNSADRESAANAFAGRLAKITEGRFNMDEAKLQADAILPGTSFSELFRNSTTEKKQQRMTDLFDTMTAGPREYLNAHGIKMPTKSRIKLNAPVR